MRRLLTLLHVPLGARLYARLLALLLTLVGACVAAPSAHAQRTTRPRLRPAAPVVAPDEAPGSDSIICADSIALSFRGYDKPLRAHRESFFAINADTALAVAGFTLTITYYDTSGRMLHRRQVRVAQEIPPGETRRIEIPSWDRNNAYYYHLSQPPARSTASPYRITLRPDSVAVR